MGFFDRLTGTRRPPPGAPALPAGQLYDALAALDRDDVPWSIRPGAPEGADLVAEWHAKAASMTFRYMIVMRLDEAQHEVHALDQLWQSGGLEGASYGQGNITHRAGNLERGPDGKIRMSPTDRFNTADLKDPLRETVTASGWTWRQRLMAM